MVATTTKQTRVKLYLPVEGEGQTTHIRFDVAYDKGGFGAFSQSVKPRGYYFSACAVECKEHDGYTSESFGIFSGTQKAVEGATKFNQKRLDALVSLAHSQIEGREGLAWDMVSKVADESGLTVQQRD